MSRFLFVLLIVLGLVNAIVAGGEVLPDVPPDAAARHAALVVEIRRHNDLYFNHATREISDRDYDALKDELLKIEACYPCLVTSESPSQQVGAPVTNRAKAVHATRMLSLDKVHHLDALRVWCNTIEARLAENGVKSQGFVAEPKVDGVALSLVYDGGQLVRAVTRGDGNEGEDATAHARQMRGIPPVLARAISLEVRGEVYLPRNAEVREGNARNIVAGTLNSSDVSLVAKRGLEFFAYQVIGAELLGIETQGAICDFLRSLNFVADASRRRWCASVDEVVTAVSLFQDAQEAFHYDADGVVIKVNSLAAQRSLGERTTAPAWAIAYKFPVLQAETHIEAILIQVSKAGVLTPVAQVAPTALNGTTVTRVSLHNMEFVARHDIRAGDRIAIERAGDVIPHFVKNFPELRTGEEAVFAAPDVCPSCGAACVKRSGSVTIVCPNSGCAAQLRGRLIHFASRDGMRLTGWGPATIDKLLARDLLHDVVDLFILTPEQITDALGVKRPSQETFPKSVVNLHQSLEAGKSRGLATVLTSLSIPQIGSVRAAAVAAKYDSMDAVMRASVTDLAATPCGTATTPRTLGPAAAQSLHDFLAHPNNRDIIARLAQSGVAMHARPVQDDGVSK